MVSSESFKNVLGGVQSFMVAIGIIVGGAWTYLTFGGVGDQVGPILDIGILAESIRDSGAGGEAYLRVVATVVNRGKSRADLDFKDQPPLTIAHIGINNNGEVGYRVILEKGVAAADPGKGAGAIIELGKVVLLPSVTKTYSFLVPGLESGIYFVTFNARRAADATTLWTGGVFVDIKPSSPDEERPKPAPVR